MTRKEKKSGPTKTSISTVGSKSKPEPSSSLDHSGTLTLFGGGQISKPAWARKEGAPPAGFSPSKRDYVAYAGAGSVIPGEITVYLQDGRKVKFRRMSTAESLFGTDNTPEPIVDSMHYLGSGRPSPAPKEAPGPASY